MTAIDSPAQTTPQQLHIPGALDNFALGYHPSGFIAEQVFPVVPVQKENDLFYKWDKQQAFRLPKTDGTATKIADGAIAGEELFGTTQDGYVCDQRKRRVRVTDREAGNADTVLNLTQSRVRRAQDKVLLDQELAVANILRTDGNYNGSTTNLATNSSSTQWNNSSFASLGTVGTGHSLIVAQLQTGITAIRKNTGGYRPNKIIIPFDCAQVLANDPGWADMFKFVSNLAQLQQDNALGLVPARILGMQVLIPSAMYVSNVEGESSALTDVWGKDVILLYAPETPAPDDLAAGFIFRKSPWQVRSYRKEESEATYYEPTMVQAEKFITTDCCYRIKNAVA